MNEILRPGFVYTIELLKHGRVLERETVHNIIPEAGLNYLLSAAFKGGTQHSDWFVGLYEGNYNPQMTDTAAAFPGLATECTTYTSLTRPAWASGAVAAGAVNNTASRAEFTSNALRTIYGGFITSNPAKGAITGVLVSAVRFSSPKTFEPDSVLRVTAGFTMTSL